ncbi:hypothetical protein KUCAC02_013351, partial [Chaenocephalus aceratus]
SASLSQIREEEGETYSNDFVSLKSVIPSDWLVHPDFRFHRMYSHQPFAPLELHPRCPLGWEALNGQWTQTLQRWNNTLPFGVFESICIGN